MRYPKLRELKEAIKALLTGPYTTKFPKEPHVPPVGFRGKPTPDKDGCIACGACAEVCPAAAIEVEDRCESSKGGCSGGIAIPQKMANSNSPATFIRSITWHYDKCIFCGQCERLCTTREELTPGVKLTQEYDLATTDRTSLFSVIEKELIVCEGCREVISTKEHFNWLIKKLGPLAYGNFNLNYFAQKHPLGLKDISGEKIEVEPIRRQDLFKINCPKCRHIVLVFNQTGK